ncbi:MAG: metal-sulfur cluster assembly factor [Actinomycetota bacterium]
MDELAPDLSATSDSATSDEAGPSSGRHQADETADGASPTGDLVLDALRNVYDPELGINIVDLGLVYTVEVEGGVVRIEYTLTTMGCPIGPLIERQMHALVAGIPGVEEVDIEMVLRPPWGPDMMSEEAKAALGFF